MSQLAELLRLERPLVVPDVETTGVNPTEDRIVEIGFVMLYPVGDDRPDKEYRTLVNPERPIPEEVQRIHHIDDEAVAGKPSWRQLAASFAKGFKDCDYAGKNVRFDLQFIAAEMSRANVPWTYSDARVLDVDRLMQLVEPRHLSDLYKRATGEELAGAHGALNDVKATVTVLEWQFNTWPKLPRNLELLHKEQWPGQIDSEGKFKFVDGVPVVNFGKKYKLVPMRKVDPSFFEWMLKQDFSAEVKAIARDAIAGKYPRA